MKQLVRKLISPIVLRMLASVGFLEIVERTLHKLELQELELLTQSEVLRDLKAKNEPRVKLWISENWGDFKIPTQLVRDVRIGTLIFPSFDSTMAPWINSKGSWDEKLCTFLIRNLKPGMNFVNVGSNVGYFAILASLILSKEDTIWAFEPHPHIFEIAQMNSSLHVASNIRNRNLAASNFDSELMMYESLDNGGDHRLWKHETTDSSPFRVRSVRLDEQLVDHRVDFILLDTQGWDHFALLGTIGIITSQKPLIVCEFTPMWLQSLGLDPEECILEYIGWGYEVLALELPHLPSSEIVKFMTVNEIVEVNLVLRAKPQID